MVELLAEFNSTGEAADTRPGAQLLDDPALHRSGGSDADVDSEPPEVSPPPPLPQITYPHPQPRLPTTQCAAASIFAAPDLTFRPRANACTAWWCVSVSIASTVTAHCHCTLQTTGFYR